MKVKINNSSNIYCMQRKEVEMGLKGMKSKDKKKKQKKMKKSKVILIFLQIIIID